MNDNTSADPDQEKVAPSEQEALARLTDTLANTKPTDSEQSRAQTHAANWTAGATVAIAFFTFVTIGVGIAQWRILSGTLAEMRDEQRPWLQVVVKLTGPLVNDGGTVKTNAGIEIKNIGHRPAMEVRATAQLAYRPKMFTPHSDRLGAFCTGEALSIWQWLSLDSGTDIVFPDGKRHDKP